MRANVLLSMRTVGQIPALLGLLALLAATAPGQEKNKLPREEEEEPGKGKPKVILRIDDEPLPAPSAMDLKREADQARHEPIRALFKKFIVPKDVVTLPAGTAHEVTPLAEFFDPKEATRESVQLTPVDGKPPVTVSRKQIARVEPYEALAVRLVGEFLASKDGIARLDKLRAAEILLAEVVRFHESARQRGLRKGKAGWEDVEKQLRAKLLDVRLEQLDVLASEKNWAAAQQLADQLAEIYFGQQRWHSALIRFRVLRAEDGLKDDQIDGYLLARRVLDELQRQFLRADQEEPVKRLQAKLRQKAASLLQTVNGLPEPKRLDQLRTIESLCPDLPGLQPWLEKTKDYRVLHVGFRHLPAQLSPATAFLDSEKLALDLLFESLVRLVPDPVTGQRYEPLLSQTAPEQSLLSRQFEMVHDAWWYRETPGGQVIKEPVQAADVVRTVLAHQKRPARSAEWHDLLGGAQVEGDQHTVRLNLQQGYVDPLALMTFRVLPARFVQQLDDRDFAQRPVGSGPYQYLGQHAGRDRPFARFLLNPTYGSRAGKTEPNIREIRFYALKEDVRADLANLPLHVVYDLPTKQIEEVRSKEAGVPNIHVLTVKNRRIWFLAVNHRKAPLQQEQLRRALGLAIDRGKILDDAFRAKDSALRTKGTPGEVDRSMHRALTGPYPAGSWACNPNPLLDLDRPEDARARAKSAALAGTTLTLKYPSDLHPDVPRACQLIQEQVDKATGIKLVLKPVPWRELHHAVEREHDYELAYYCWDHADDRYWLWPLFDPAGTVSGGCNFLGVQSDPELAELFRRARGRRQFSQLQQITHLIHQHINQRMHLIPLWQLDTHIVLRHEVTTVPATSQLDPLRLFGQVEGWKLK